MGYSIQKYWPASANSYARGIKKAGFGGYDYVGGWLFGKKVATPKPKHDRSGMKQSFFIEKIVNKHLSLGLKYTWFKGDVVRGWDGNTNLDYNESDPGKGYFIYFIRHSDPRRVISLRCGLGFGGTNVTFSGWTGYSWEKNNGIVRELSGWSFNTDFSMGVRTILFGKFVFETHIQYWYILPQTIDPFSFCYQGSEFNLPDKKLILAGSASA